MTIAAPSSRVVIVNYNSVLVRWQNVHDVHDSVDYAVDWSPILLSGETIITSDWYGPEGFVFDKQEISGVKTGVWISLDPNVPNPSQIQNQIKTSADRIIRKTIQLTVGPN